MAALMEHEHTKKIGWTIALNLAITLAEYIGGALRRSDYLKK
jgi:hypothetical protein